MGSMQCIIHCCSDECSQDHQDDGQGLTLDVVHSGGRNVPLNPTMHKDGLSPQRMVDIHCSCSPETQKGLLTAAILQTYTITGGIGKSLGMHPVLKTCLPRSKTQPIPIITIWGDTQEICRGCPPMHCT